MVKFLIIGPVTRDTILKDDSTCRGIGGPVYYQSSVLSSLKADVTAIITLGKSDENLLKHFPPELELLPIWGLETMVFENRYPDEDPNHRIQRACIPSNPVKISNLSNIDLGIYDAVLLSPLSPFDVPLETLKHIKNQGAMIYLGAQGYLRHLEGHKVVLKPWDNYKKFLKYVDFLFIDEVEAGVVIGEDSLPLEEISRKLSLFGPKEVIITRGSRGSIVYSGSKGEIYQIPAFPSKKIIDPTGLGDSYLAAYALRMQEVGDPYESGIFAALVSSLKLEKKGAFHGTRQQIQEKRSEFISLINQIK